MDLTVQIDEINCQANGVKMCFTTKLREFPAHMQDKQNLRRSLFEMPCLAKDIEIGKPAKNAVRTKTTADKCDDIGKLLLHFFLLFLQVQRFCLSLSLSPYI